MRLGSVSSILCERREGRGPEYRAFGVSGAVCDAVRTDARVRVHGQWLVPRVALRFVEYLHDVHHPRVDPGFAHCGLKL